MTTQARELAKLVNNSGDVNLGDDITLGSDGALLNFGADSDVVITHVADTGLLLNSTRQLQFGDSGTYIHQSADGVLDLVSDTEIELNATTLDINANVDISGTLTVAGALDFGDAVLSNVGAVALDSISGDADANTSITFSGSDVITITTGGETQVTFNNGSILPTTDNDIDLGSSSLQFKDAHFHGTVETDALTIGGTTLAETIADTVGAMVSSNTETNISVSYDDSDNTLDFVVGTVGTANESGLATNVTATANNSADETVFPTFVDGATGSQGIETDTGFTYNPSSGMLTAAGFTGAVTGNVTGSAATLTTARTIHGVSFDGSANIDLTEVVQDTVGAMVSSNTESGITVAYQDADGTLDFTVGTLNQNTTGTAATVTGAAQTNITSLGTLTTLTVDDITINGSTISDGADLTLDVEGDIILDANGGDIRFKDAGTAVAVFENDSLDFKIVNSTQDKDIIFRGNDGGSGVDALTLDMSDAGTAIFNHDVQVPDNGKFTAGAGSDLQIYHDGSNSYIAESGSGSLVIKADDLYIQNAAGTENMALFVEDGAVTLYHNNSAKIATASTGVSVTGSGRGTLTTDNDGSFDMNASNNFKCTPSGNFTLTFTNIASQSGNILLINSGGHTVSAHSNTKVDANILGTISTAGTYLLAYFSDGTNVYMTNSAIYS